MAWLVLKRRRHEGPYNTDALAQNCQEGRLHPQDFIIDSGDLERGAMRYRRIIEILPHLTEVPKAAPVAQAPVPVSVASAPAPVRKPTPSLSVAAISPSAPAVASEPQVESRIDAASVAISEPRVTPEFKRNAIAGLVLIGAGFAGVFGYSKLGGGHADRRVASQEAAAPAPTTAQGTPTSIPPRADRASRRSKKGAVDSPLRLPSLPEPPQHNNSVNVLPEPPPPEPVAEQAPDIMPPSPLQAMEQPQQFDQPPPPNDNVASEPAGVAPASESPPEPMPAEAPPGPVY